MEEMTFELNFDEFVLADHKRKKGYPRPLLSMFLAARQINEQSYQRKRE